MAWDCLLVAGQLVDRPVYQRSKSSGVTALLSGHSETPAGLQA